MKNECRPELSKPKHCATSVLQQISKGHILLSLAELWSSRTELGWTVAYITETRTNIASIAAQAHNNTRVQLAVSSAIQDSSASPESDQNIQIRLTRKLPVQKLQEIIKTCQHLNMHASDYYNSAMNMLELVSA
jgi:hypothetical protein